MKPMQALAQLRELTMNSVLPCTPMHAERLLQDVGAGLEEVDALRAELEAVKATPAKAKAKK